MAGCIVKALGAYGSGTRFRLGLEKANTSDGLIDKEGPA